MASSLLLAALYLMFRDPLVVVERFPGAFINIFGTANESVFGVGFSLLHPCFFGLDGVLYSMPVSDLLILFSNQNAI